jgi:polyisoprenoid-binding protein YceI
MKSTLYAAFFFIISLNSFAQSECVSIKASDVTIKWTAFKTPAKVGVQGTFTKFTLDGKASGKTVKEAVYDLSTAIESPIVSTGDKARDNTLSKNFFNKLANKGEIKANVKSINDKNLVITVVMNKVTRDVPLTYTLENNQLKANGVIDILDFSGSEALKSINKACFALHEGKTWSDVGLELQATFKPCAQ